MKCFTLVSRTYSTYSPPQRLWTCCTGSIGLFSSVVSLPPYAARAGFHPQFCRSQCPPRRPVLHVGRRNKWRVYRSGGCPLFEPCAHPRFTEVIFILQDRPNKLAQKWRSKSWPEGKLPLEFTKLILTQLHLSLTNRSFLKGDHEFCSRE